MQPTLISISEDGIVRFLVNDTTKGLLDEDCVTRRASHVEPVSSVLRTIFHVLRRIFGDKGWMATFTRRWPCFWRINFTPINGPILNYVYRDRQQAIEAEIEWLNKHFLQGEA